MRVSVKEMMLGKVCVAQWKWYPWYCEVSMVSQAMPPREVSVTESGGGVWGGSWAYYGASLLYLPLQISVGCVLQLCVTVQFTGRENGMVLQGGGNIESKISGI